MTRTGQEWTALGWNGDPLLLIGWRPRARALAAARVKIEETAFNALTEITSVALNKLSVSQAVPFGTYTDPDPGEEYLTLPRRSGVFGNPQLDDDESAHVAQLLELLAQPITLDELTGTQAAEAGGIFYAVLRRTPAGESIAFVKALSPTAILGKSHHYFSTGDALASTTRPNMALANDADLVITADEVAVIHRSAFNRLFSDTDYAAAEVAQNLDALAGRLPAGLNLSPQSRGALEAQCRRLPTLAKRLHRLAEDQVLDALTPAKVRRALRNHNEPVKNYINTQGSLTFDGAHAKHFLDLVEGRWWTSDFGEEPRRADRYRTR